MIRHGYSEANHVQKVRRLGADAAVPPEFDERHDVHMRLTSVGREQARITGAWLNGEFPAGFYRYYVSPLIRTLETAGALDLNNAAWRKDDRWRERDWGEYASLSDGEAADKYALSKKLRTQHRWYWCPPGGESLATGVRLRFEQLVDHMYRETPGKSNIAITHGEMMEVASVVLERLEPDEWLERNKDPHFDMGNCQVLHYTRANPETGAMTPDLRWRRSVNIWDSTKNWDDGEWVELQPRRLYSGEQLLEQAAQIQRLFPDV
jgi:broad specificity phosphatase PhoE